MNIITQTLLTLPLLGAATFLACAPATAQTEAAGDEEVLLTTVTLRDPGNRNMASHTVLVPKGWQTRGGVTWTPEVSMAYVHLEAAISAEDGREVVFYPNGDR